MNEGFIAIWLMTMVIILFLTGWHDQVAEEVPRWAIWLVILATFALHAVVIPVGGDVLVRGSASCTAAAAIWSLLAFRQASHALFCVLCSMLVGFVWLWVRYMYTVDPVFILFHPLWDGPLIAGFLGGLMAERFRPQFTMIMLAALVSSFADLIRPFGAAEPIIIGSLSWWDGFAIALVTVRLTGKLKIFILRAAERLLEGEAGQ